MPFYGVRRYTKDLCSPVNGDIALGDFGRFDVHAAHICVTPAPGQGVFSKFCEPTFQFSKAPDIGLVDVTNSDVILRAI